MLYEVRGIFRMAPRTWQKFTKLVEAGNEEEAREKTYSLLGSNHKVKRIHIKIEEVRKAGEENGEGKGTSEADVRV